MSVAYNIQQKSYMSCLGHVHVTTINFRGLIHACLRSVTTIYIHVHAYHNLLAVTKQQTCMRF